MHLYVGSIYIYIYLYIYIYQICIYIIYIVYISYISYIYIYIYQFESHLNMCWINKKKSFKNTFIE